MDEKKLSDEEMENMKESIKAAGFHEDDLSEDEIIKVYKAIKQSEDSSIQEEQISFLVEDAERNVQEVGKLVNKDVESNIDIDYNCIDPLDCPPTLHEPLRVIDRPVKYDPPYYYSEEFLKLTPEKKKQKLMQYHQELIRKLANMQKKSKLQNLWAPLGKPVKPIIPSAKFNGSLFKENFDDYQEEYAEESMDTVTENVPHQPEKQVKRKSSPETEAVASKRPKEQQNKSPITRNKQKKLSNAEIIKKSKLFSPDDINSLTISPTRMYRTPKKRCELMFENLIKQDDQRQRQEKRDEAFARTLKDLDDDNVFEFEDDPGDPNYVEGEDVDRKRVVPPRGIKNKGKKKTNKKNADNEPALPKTKVNKFEELVIKSRISNKASGAGETESVCPICKGTFSSREIENHASSCGLPPEGDDIEELSLLTMTSSQGFLTCENCDKSFATRTDYQKHFDECIIFVK